MTQNDTEKLNIKIVLQLKQLLPYCICDLMSNMHDIAREM